MTTEIRLLTFVLATAANLVAAVTASAQNRVDPNQIDLQSMTASVTASDADFTFNVPVELRDMKQAVRVGCVVLEPDGQIGAAMTEVPLDSKGNYRGTVPVRIEAYETAIPSDATGYWCLLATIDPATGIWTQAPDPQAGSSELRPRPGTPYTSRVSGEL